MADPLVVEGVCRYFVNQSLGGKSASNIVDMNVGNLGPRAAALLEGAHQILEAWDLGPLTKQNAELIPISVSWLDLDSLVGTTGSTQTGVGGTPTWPSTGDQSGLSQPINVAVRVNKNVAAVRGLGSGRMYVPGVSEGDTDQPNTLAAARLTGWQTAMDAFFAAIDGYAFPVDGGTMTPCVVHVPESGPPSYSLVTSYTVLGGIRSQGRRLRY